MNQNLWDVLNGWKQTCKWVDLTHELSPQTPHWVGWPSMTVETKADLESSLFSAHAYTTVGQYGTHVDAPQHMVDGGRTLEQVSIKEMVMPLCVIDKTAEVAKNSDYVLTKADVVSWEEQYGKVPVGAFVVFRSDWSKRDSLTMDNLDEAGNRHFPGWGLDAVAYLVEQCQIGGIGHETSDTEAPITSGISNYEVEYYILAKDRIQVELLTNLDQCPPTGAIIFCTFPSVKGGTGFPARCFAICP